MTKENPAELIEGHGDWDECLCSRCRNAAADRIDAIADVIAKRLALQELEIT